jgi:hypothetical protein
MFGMVALEVLIGLVLVYLLLSLVCSTIQEAFAAWLNWRGDMLRSAIQRLLADDKALADKLYAHPLVDALKKDEREPSYIPNRTFAEALVGILSAVEGAPPVRSAEDRLRALERALESGTSASSKLPSTLQRALANLFEMAKDKLAVELKQGKLAEGVADAAKTLDAFKHELDAWFERTMNRATGWYRRKSQLWQYVIATVVVAITNADTLMITEQLANDPEARAVAVQAAVDLVETPPQGVETKEAGGAAPTGAVPTGTAPTGAVPTDEAAAKQAYLEARKRADDAVERFEEVTSRAQLRVGWPDPRWQDANSEEAQLDRWQRWARKLLGLAITICAVALGAPFWFQMLEKLVKLRSSGARATSDAPAATERPPTP